MKNNLSDYRKSYEKDHLTELSIDKNPFNQFKNWFKEVEKIGGEEEVNAMTVSTIGMDGFPKSRVVLLKHFDENGFVFYTNYNSEKGKALLNNPKICISFFWPTTERQVIIRGLAEKTSDTQSDNYFNSRPEGSKLGALASPQSEVIPDHDFLEKKLSELEENYAGKNISRPNHWGGFLVKPLTIEFWQGRPNRLHDRIQYTLQENSWKIERLAP